MTRAETAAFLREHDNYCILTHRRPDGDTIGSSAALCLALRALGKTAWLLRNPQFTPRFAAVLDGLVCEDVPDEATIVSVDVAAPDLLPIGREGLAAQVQLVIDHHARSSVSAEHRLVEAERAACGEIIFGLLELLGVSVDVPMAEAIYIAISTDTGCFQYSNTNAATLRAAARLLELGADNHKISQEFFRKISRARMALEGMIYSGMRFFRDGKISIAVITQAMLDQAGATEDDCDDLAGLAGKAERSVVSVTIRELDTGESKISVRSNPEVDSCAICAVYGGGGHKMAAGCTIDCPPEEAVENILRAIDQVWPA